MMTKAKTQTMPQVVEDNSLELVPASENRFAMIEQNNYCKFIEASVMHRTNPEVWERTPVSSFDDLGSHPNLGEVLNYRGHDFAKTMILVLCENMLRPLGLNAFDFDMIAESILEESWRDDDGVDHGGFRSFSIMDVKLCFILGMKGKFNKPYGEWRLTDVTNSQDGWIVKYWEEKVKHSRLQKFKKKEVFDLPVSDADIPMPEHIKAAMNKKIEMIGKETIIPDLPRYFKTIEQYCDICGQDYVKILEKAEQDYFISDRSSPQELFVRSWLNTRLREINDYFKKRRPELVKQIIFIESIFEWLNRES